MAERIRVAHEGTIYSVRPLSEQSIRDGIARTDCETDGEGYIFEVKAADRARVLEAIEQIEKYLNDHDRLAVTDTRLQTWVGTIETKFVPPVEVIGPELLLRREV